MSTQVQYRRGSNVQVAAFTGALGELVIDTTNKVVVVNDGATVGGFPQVGLTASQTITNKVYQGTSVSVTGSVTAASTSVTGAVTAASTVGGIITGTSASVTGNITGAYILGNGSQLTGVDATQIINGTSNAKVLSSGGNIAVGIGGTGSVAVFATSGVYVAGVVSATGNITASYFVGNGSQLSGIDATSIQNGNSNVKVLSSGGNVSISVGGSGIVSFTSSGIINNMGNATGNIGNSTGYFNTIFAKATSAQYADLAEMYVADQTYSPGTVVEFGGANEITQTTHSHSTQVAGIVSTNPSYLMNATQQGTHVLPVALIGRVPCRVVGNISKGDRLVSSGQPGTATVLDPDQYQPASIIGKALESYNSDQPGIIEVAVGRT